MEGPKLGDVVAFLRFVALSLECIKVYCTRQLGGYDRITHHERWTIYVQNSSDIAVEWFNLSTSREQEFLCT